MFSRIFLHRRQFHVDLKISLINFIQIYQDYTAICSPIGLLYNFWSTADTDISIYPFVCCAFLLAMATSVRKTFTTDVGWFRGTAVERRSLTGELSVSALDLQLTDDHLCG